MKNYKFYIPSLYRLFLSLSFLFTISYTIHAESLSHQYNDRAFTLSFPDHRLIRIYTERYTENQRLQWIERSLDRGAYYRTFILSKIRERTMPIDLIYLPLVESAYNPYAISRSGAVGLWQFMENSIHPYNITIESWLDERRDFWKATEAALSKLEYNYTQLGNWLLAIAAYNCGLNRMKSIIRTTGIRDYWQLVDGGYLPIETAHFIPKLAAIVSICNDPERYGLPLTWDHEYQWVRLMLTRAVDIRILAEKTGIPLKLLQYGNAELNYHITPPVSTGYSLKVPYQYTDEIEKALAEEGDLIRFYLYTIKSGDTLYDLATHYKVTVEMLRRHNPGIHPRKLRLGSRVIIPYFEEVPPYVGKTLSGSDRYKDRQAVHTLTYTVSKGDSLWNISRTFETTPEQLAEWNRIPLHATIHPGMDIRVPDFRREEWEKHSGNLCR